MSRRHKRKALKRERIAAMAAGRQRFDEAVLAIGRMLFAKYMRTFLNQRIRAEGMPVD